MQVRPETSHAQKPRGHRVSVSLIGHPACSRADNVVCWHPATRRVRFASDAPADLTGALELDPSTRYRASRSGVRSSNSAHHRWALRQKWFPCLCFRVVGLRFCLFRRSELQPRHLRTCRPPHSLDGFQFPSPRRHLPNPYPVP